MSYNGESTGIMAVIGAIIQAILISLGLYSDDEVCRVASFVTAIIMGVLIILVVTVLSIA